MEWSEPIRRFNTLCSDYVLRGYLAPGQVAVYRDERLEAEDERELFAAMHATLEPSARHGVDDDEKAAFDRMMGMIEGAPASHAFRPALDSPEVLVPAGAASRAIAFDASGAERVIWRSAPQRTGKRARAVGLTPVTLASAPAGTVIEHVYDLVGAPLVGLAPCVIADGMYPREDSAGSARRWTGPGLSASFVLTLCRAYDAEICLHINDALQSAVYEQAWLEVDGLRLPTLKSSRDSRLLVAPIPATPEARLDRVGIVLHAPRTLTPSAIIPGNVDHRQLGLALGRLEIRQQVTTSPLRQSSPAAQIFADMMNRSAGDIVYGGYRDLLGRLPDPAGSSDYFQQLSEGRLGAANFFRILIGSDEFKARYAAPGLAEMIDRLLPGD